MVRLATVFVAIGLMLSPLACTDSCESVQNEIEEIGREIQKNPASAPDRAGELESLRKKLEDMGCLG